MRQTERMSACGRRLKGPGKWFIVVLFFCFPQISHTLFLFFNNINGNVHGQKKTVKAMDGEATGWQWDATKIDNNDDKVSFIIYTI